MEMHSKIADGLSFVISSGTWGPSLGMRQIVISRYSFGYVQNNSMPMFPLTQMADIMV